MVPAPVSSLANARVIIVDDSREYMAILRRMLAGTFPEIEITEYDPDQKGKPDPRFDWSIYDVVLIDHDLGGKETGLEWLHEFRRLPRFPPAILMTTQGNEYLAARAIKLGAFDYIKKQDITTARIGHMLAAAVDESRPHADPDVTLQQARDVPHLAILERLAGRITPSDTALQSGEGYRFVRLIGQGASSRVYLAERSSDETTLVLKVIDADSIMDIQVVERFIREAEIVATVSSPYVVKFFDHGLTQTYGYIAMEFFTRGDLKQRLERGVTSEDALNYLRHIALGLEAIHSRGIVHRDLKPGNIMFRADDSLALADFGISRRTEQTSDLTNQGCVLGTPNYLSPEQALGQQADHRADLYAAGAVLYEMLAGRKPFRADNAAALVYQHVHAPVPALPKPVCQFQPLLNRLMAKQPEERFASARDFIAALDRLREVERP